MGSLCVYKIGRYGLRLIYETPVFSTDKEGDHWKTKAVRHAAINGPKVDVLGNVLAGDKAFFHRRGNNG